MTFQVRAEKMSVWLALLFYYSHFFFSRRMAGRWAHASGKGMSVWARECAARKGTPHLSSSIGRLFTPDRPSSKCMGERVWPGDGDSPLP